MIYLDVERDGGLIKKAVVFDIEDLKQVGLSFVCICILHCQHKIKIHQVVLMRVVRALSRSR